MAGSAKAERAGDGGWVSARGAAWGAPDTGCVAAQPPSPNTKKAVPAADLKNVPHDMQVRLLEPAATHPTKCLRGSFKHQRHFVLARPTPVAGADNPTWEL